MDVKEEHMEIKEEELDIVEDQIQNGHHSKQISTLDESQVRIKNKKVIQVSYEFVYLFIVCFYSILNNCTIFK